MKDLLQMKSKIAGIEILRMELMEFSFHHNIAQGLLKVQQAKAKVEARKLIVKANVLIVRDALTKLEEEDVEINKNVKEKLVKDLMILTCSDRGTPIPVIRM